MASNHTRVQASKAGLDVSSTTTDSPILPIEQLDRLREIAPDRVEWVFDQTEIESNYRRAENHRINTMIFAERALGLLFALVVAVLGLGCAVYLAIQDREITASIIGGATLGGLVASFLAGRSKPPTKP